MCMTVPTFETSRTRKSRSEDRQSAVNDWLATVGCRWEGFTTESIAADHRVSPSTLRRWLRAYRMLM
jgi:transposase-like protein